MRKGLFVSLLLLTALALPVRCQDNSQGYFSPDQLDNLLAPVALYPDPLLAQVLLAATFPEQIDEAARFVRANSDPEWVDGQPWDVSVKAVAHYPTVLFTMADKLDWTTALGQAYVSQSTDVMATVQRLRAEARSAGYLVSGPQQEIVDEGGYIKIWPVQPQYIYVPVYDPGLVYYRHPGFFAGITFGGGFFIGAWLNHDFDWGAGRVYYHGWDDPGRGWIWRSRAYVHPTNVYVNVNYRSVVINRTVINRSVNYGALNQYRGVHNNVHYENVRNNTVVVNNSNRGPVGNTVIERNINVHDQRIDEYRGHPGGPAPPPPPPPPGRPQFTPAAPPHPGPPAGNGAFGGGGGFDPRMASQRGHASQAAAAPPPPPAPHVEERNRRH